jgi:four helix bundle protein
MECWKIGIMKTPNSLGNVPERRSIIRGFQQLRVWQDAADLYRLTKQSVKNWNFDMKKVASQAIASADSIHRNIAEGYARRSLKEYLQFLNFAKGSLRESISGYLVYHRAEDLTDQQFEPLDSLAFRLENGLLRLISSLEQKKERGDWQDSLILRESNEAYG